MARADALDGADEEQDRMVVVAKLSGAMLALPGTEVDLYSLINVQHRNEESAG